MIKKKIHTINHSKTALLKSEQYYMCCLKKIDIIHWRVFDKLDEV